MFVCLLGAIATSFLPETFGAKLPDTVKVKLSNIFSIVSFQLRFLNYKVYFHIEIFCHTGISRTDTVLIVFFARMTNEPQNAACQQKAALTTDNCQINRLATCNKGSPEIPRMKILGIIWSLEIGFVS